MDGRSAPHAGTFHGSGRRRIAAILALVGLLTAFTFVLPESGSLRAYGVLPSTVDLGTATGYAVLAGSTVTDTGPSVLDDDLGLSPAQP